jgi:hypothetical protein
MPPSIPPFTKRRSASSVDAVSLHKARAFASASETEVIGPLAAADRIKADLATKMGHSVGKFPVFSLWIPATFGRQPGNFAPG